MNDRDRDSPVDLALFDRIVDGGMTTEELRIAIRALECEPDGWKRCATAFLEAQVLRESFRALGRSQKDEAGSESLRFHAGGSVNGPRHRWLRHAAAAGIVAASFAIGWIAHGSRPAAPAQESLAVHPVTTKPQPANELAVSESSSPIERRTADDRPEFWGDRDERSITDAPSRAIRTVARIRFGAGQLTGRGPGPCRARDHGRMADPAASASVGAWPGRPRAPWVSGRPAAAIPHGHSGRRPPRGRSRRSRSDRVHGQRAVVMFLSSQTRRSIMNSGKAWCLAIGFFLGASLSPAPTAQEQDQQGKPAISSLRNRRTKTIRRPARSRDRIRTAITRKMEDSEKGNNEAQQGDKSKEPAKQDSPAGQEQVEQSAEERRNSLTGDPAKTSRTWAQWWNYPSWQNGDQQGQAWEHSFGQRSGLGPRVPRRRLSSISPRRTIRFGNT